MPTKEPKIEATLTPSHYQKFLVIKNKRFTGMANASILRILIAEEYERIKPRNQ